VVASGGTGYAIGDTGTINGGSTLAAYVIDTVDGSGAVLTFSLTSAGLGYSIASGIATTTGGSQPGVGTDFTVNITNLATTLTSFPYRVRWSANGIPNIWDPATNISAGSNDFLDVPDSITGLLTMGSSVVYIFRTNGITEQVVNATGSALPFQWNHLWGEQRGIGNVYPGTIDSYGSVGFFVDFENIYQVSVYSFEPIGGFARDSIMADIAAATGFILGGMTDQWVNGYVYLCYMLCIPVANGTKFWIYSLEDKTWVPFFVSGFSITCKPFRLWTA